jgi:hypothetical protein
MGKKGSDPDPKPFLSGLCGPCALCGETPYRAGGPKRIVVSTYAAAPYRPSARRRFTREMASSYWARR